MKLYCNVCGSTCKKWIYKKIILDELAREWNLSKSLQKKINLRESQFCPKCKNSFRTRILAKAIMDKLRVNGVSNFNDWINGAKRLNIRVAEINSCGRLHPFLSNLSHLYYSEYPPGSFFPRLYNSLKRIPREDITNLSYKDNRFDLVLHSDVLEHVSDIDEALKECRRVLKPNGICLFTVPFIPNRKTIRRALIDKNGDEKFLKPPSYHGLDQRKDNLVFWELGYDFVTKNKIKIEHSDPQLMTYVFSVVKS